MAAVDAARTTMEAMPLPERSIDAPEGVGGAFVPPPPGVGADAGSEPQHVGLTVAAIASHSVVLRKLSKK